MYTDVKSLSLLLWGRFPCIGLFFLHHDNISAISYFFQFEGVRHRLRLPRLVKEHPQAVSHTRSFHISKLLDLVNAIPHW